MNNDQQGQRVATNPQLTKMQRTVYSLLVSTDLSVKQIAGVLGLSYDTVECHAALVYRKLGVTGRVGLLVQRLKESEAESNPFPTYAARHGYEDPMQGSVAKEQ